VWACQASSVAAISTAIALLLTPNEEEDAPWATQLPSTGLPLLPQAAKTNKLSRIPEFHKSLNVTYHAKMKP
jgi:hypothetical protein